MICRYCSCCYKWPKCMSNIIDVSDFSFRVWKRAVCTADYECWQPSPCRQQQFWGVISKLAMTQTEIERERRHWQLDRVINAALETSYPTIQWCCRQITMPSHYKTILPENEEHFLWCQRQQKLKNIKMTSLLNPCKTDMNIQAVLKGICHITT